MGLRRTLRRLALLAALRSTVGCRDEAPAGDGGDATAPEAGVRDAPAGEPRDDASAPLDVVRDGVAAELPRDAPDTAPADLPDAAPADLPDAASDAAPCVRSFACDARTAETVCGVRTGVGLRHPDLGAPYCPSPGSRAGCSCELLRCESPPLCPGTYTAVFQERLLAGCDGTPGDFAGGCDTLWNVIAARPSGVILSERRLYNVALMFALRNFAQAFTLTEPTAVRVLVQQSTWFSDVGPGGGDSGRAEVVGVTIGR